MTALPTLIRVTGEHIAEGEPGECGSCPIALALTEALGAPEDDQVIISVYNDTVIVSHGNLLSGADLPQSAIDFIHRFDIDLDVKPFEFELTWRRTS